MQRSDRGNILLVTMDVLAQRNTLFPSTHTPSPQNRVQCSDRGNIMDVLRERQSEFIGHLSAVALRFHSLYQKLKQVYRSICRSIRCV